MSIEDTAPLFATWPGGSTDSDEVVVDNEKNIHFGTPSGYAGTTLSILTKDGDGAWVVHTVDSTAATINVSASNSYSSDTLAAAIAGAVVFKLRSSTNEAGGTKVRITGK